MTTRRFDDAVVGAGIIGLAHAYTLAQRGRKVIVFERRPRPQGASVRNFGMLWPIGQPAGPLRALAMRSRAVWLDVLAKAGAWHDKVGSLHLAHADDEARVLREFHEESRRTGFECELIAPSDALVRSKYLRQEGLQLALWSPNETCVDPRVTCLALIEMLRDVMEVTFQMHTQVTACQPPRIAAGSRMWEAERIWICAGDELQALFPQQLKELGLVRCKLQMMRTEPLRVRLGPMLAAGLTLQHYAAFRKCPSLPALQRRLATGHPEHLRYGIHVMVSQNGLGELTIGDSHEYGEDITPFDNVSIDALILDYLKSFLDTSQIQIQSRWHGYYVKHQSQPYVVLTPAESVVAIAGLGGHGMTLSFGLAEDVVTRALEPEPMTRSLRR